MSILRIAIAHVVERRAQEQVLRIHTTRVVALVANEKVIRDRTNQEQVGIPVCALTLSLAYEEPAVTTSLA